MLQSRILFSKWANILKFFWLVVAISTIWLIVSHFSTIYNPSSFVCTPSEDCYLPNKFMPGELAALPDQGKALVSFLLTVETLTWVTWIVVGILIFWRKSGEPMGLFGSIFLITFLSSIVSGYTASSPGELIFLIQSMLVSVGQSSLLLMVFIFPDGLFVPRWSRWFGMLIGFLCAYMFLGPNLMPSTDQVFFPGFGFIYFGLFILGIILQVYRYFRVSNHIQRQQTKWVVVAIAMVPFSDLLFRSILVPKLFPALMVPGPTHILWNAITIPLFRTLPFLMVPVAFGFSILKYRLWDIDVLVRRTLVYSSLTGLLGVGYFSSVALLQGVITANRGSQAALSSANGSQPSTIVIVVTTLLVAALFNPLRRRLQETIERRFYRQKYDSEKALAEFAAEARSVTDLAHLYSGMIKTVTETLQPEKVDLWLTQR